MRRDDRLYPEHMLDTARKPYGKVRKLNRGVYDGDENLRLALAHLIQVLGEAAGRVSSETCRTHPEIPWREITGRRHRIVHDYIDVDEDVVWVVATEDLAPLIRALEATVPSNER